MTNHLFKISLLLLSFFSISGICQDTWELKKDKNEIQVYVLNDETADFKPYRAVTILEGNIAAFETLLRDIPNMSDWALSVKKAEVLKEIGDSIQIYYTEAKAPFPFKNRDGVYQNTFRWSEEGTYLYVDVKILPEYIEIDEDMERVSGFGHWRITDLGDGKIEIFNEMHIDPGGNIPAWLANSFADENPYQTMISIREIMEEKD